MTEPIKTKKTPAVKSAAKKSAAAASSTAAEKKPAAKKTVAAKSAPKQPAAVAKKPAVEKKPAVKQAEKPATPVSVVTETLVIVSDEQRYRMIAEAAYFRAECHQFQSDPLRDWIEAEKDIAALIGPKSR